MHRHFCYTIFFVTGDVLLRKRFVKETFCQETFCRGDVLLRRRFVRRRFVEETFCKETFWMCVDSVQNRIIGYLVKILLHPLEGTISRNRFRRNLVLSLLILKRNNQTKKWIQGQNIRNCESVLTFFFALRSTAQNITWLFAVLTRRMTI